MPERPEFTEADLRQLAGPKSFERGQDYLHEVTDLDVTRTGATATVRGSYDYAVFLDTGAGALTAGCSCPYGQEGNFCKHCVAVGLAVLAAGEDLPLVVEATRARKAAFGQWLESLSRDELLAELRALLDADPEARRRLELRAATASVDVILIRQTVAELIVPRDYISYQEAGEYTAGVCEAAAAIDRLADAGAPGIAIDLAREAISLLDQATGYLDESSGVGSDAAAELLAAHLNACLAAPPEPESLADYLATLLLHHDLAPDLLALADYGSLLGEAGFGRLRDRISAAYAVDPHGWRAKWLMESVARAEDDVDAIVAIYAADLDDRGWNHLRIAQELDRAGRSGEALGWAERGLREAGQPDPRLTEYLADRYASAGRAADVLALRWTRFQAQRTLVNYQSLRQAAEHSGTWATERDQAVGLLAADAARARGQNWPPWAAGPVLIDVLLDDGELDAAWAAADGVASQEQWLRLADAVAASRPADALPVYLRTVEPLRAQTGNAVYEQVARLLLAARGCHRVLGTTGEFDQYLALFRMDQKRKRNLMKILDQNGLRVAGE